MKTSTIKQQASTMLGAILLMLTVLCLLFLDTIYLTSSVRTVFVIAGITGGLLLMAGMRIETTVEVELKKEYFPVNELKEQQVIVHQGNINRLRQLEDDMSRLARLEMRPDDTEAWNRVNEYLLIRLGKEQNMLQSLGWEKEVDDNKKAWEGHRNTIVQANNAEKKEESFEDYHNKVWDKLEKETMKLNPATENEYWYKEDGTPYTISVYDYNKLNKEDILVMITDDTRGRKVRG